MHLLHTDKQVIRQILAVANYDDTIELGLQVIPQSPSLASAVGLP